MSRNIPPVRTWRVRWRDAHNVIRAETTVQTINKAFARWVTRNHPAWFAGYPGIRVTVSLVRKPNMCR